MQVCSYLIEINLLIYGEIMCPIFLFDWVGIGCFCSIVFLRIGMMSLLGF